MKLTGGCHCGAIRYRAEAAPAAVVLCHCSDCQRLSGSPYRASVRVDAASFVLEQGELKTYVKTADSGNRREQSFCGQCGTPIHSGDLENPLHYVVRLGSIDQRADLPPALQIWRQSALGWSADLSGIPAKPREP